MVIWLPIVWKHPVKTMTRDLFFASTECTLYFDFILCTQTFNGFWNGTRKNPRFPRREAFGFLNSGSVGSAIANEVSVILTSLSILFLDRWLGQIARGRLEDKGSRSLEVSTGHAHRQPAAPVPLCLRTVPTRRRADPILNRNWFRSSLCLLWITSRES